MAFVGKTTGNGWKERAADRGQKKKRDELLIYGCKVKFKSLGRIRVVFISFFYEKP